MTKDEVEKIEAGRGMNLLISAIMGEHEFAPHFRNNAICAICGGSGTAYGHYKLKDYSTDIAAAWEVAEKMMENGICKISNGDGDSCDVDFFSYGSLITQWGKANVTENTFPLAICRTALLATLDT